MCGLAGRQITDVAQTNLKRAKGVDLPRSEPWRPRLTGSSGFLLLRFLLPPRRHSDVGQAEQGLDACPLSHVVALGRMAHPLKEVADEQSTHSPIPGNSREA